MRVRRRFQAIAFPVAGFVLAISMTALCRGAAGVSLGLFFGGVVFATLIVPPLVAGERGLARRLVIPVVVTVGVAIVWLTALGERFALTQWAACGVALLMYAFAVGGLCALCAPEKHPRRMVLVSAAIMVVFLLWLSWPVWLSAVLARPIGETLVDWLVPAHPLFAINAVLDHFDTWDRYPLAYSRLTVLNQDVFYRMPAGVLWTTVAHGLFAVAAIGLAWHLERNETRRVNSTSSIESRSEAKSPING